MKKYIIGFIGFILLTSLVNAGEKDIRTMIESIGEKLVKASLEGDYETILSYHTEDVIVMPDFHPMLRGKKALRESYEDSKRRGSKIHSLSGTPSDFWICGDMAFELGTFGLSASSNESPHPVALHGSYFEIWEKTGNTYKIKFSTWNLDYNPWEKKE
jgi:ketosteroid isomerase-like protein